MHNFPVSPAPAGPFSPGVTVTDLIMYKDDDDGPLILSEHVENGLFVGRTNALFSSDIE